MRRALATLLLACGLGACAFERPASDVPVSYDFGPPPAYARANPALPGTVLVSRIRAPAWLEDDSIVYRLAYEDAARTRAYALSRWAAEPADLMTERLRSRMAAISAGVVSPAFGARSDYTLRVELDDFSQHFEAPGASRVLLRARATLLQSERRTLIAQREFDIALTAPPNAPGAVKALTDATHQFLEAVGTWAVESARGAGPK